MPRIKLLAQMSYWPDGGVQERTAPAGTVLDIDNPVEFQRLSNLPEVQIVDGSMKPPAPPTIIPMFDPPAPVMPKRRGRPPNLR